MQLKKQQLELDMEKKKKELDMEQQTGEAYIKAAYCYPAYLTYIQSTSYEMLG